MAISQHETVLRYRSFSGSSRSSLARPESSAGPSVAFRKATVSRRSFTVALLSVRLQMLVRGFRGAAYKKRMES